MSMLPAAKVSRRISQSTKLYLYPDCSKNCSQVRARTLELELANRSLQVSQAAAEEASRAKSEFLANMSHEIRSSILLSMFKKSTSLNSTQENMCLEPAGCSVFFTVNKHFSSHRFLYCSLTASGWHSGLLYMELLVWPHWRWRPN